MQLQQSGDQVTGNYSHDQGRIDGTAFGSQLVGTWSEAPSYSPPDDGGDLGNRDVRGLSILLRQLEVRIGGRLVRRLDRVAPVNLRAWCFESRAHNFLTPRIARRRLTEAGWPW